MTNKNVDTSEYGESNEFPYRFLLRWAWPEHIDRAVRLSLWAWLNAISEECSDHAGDYDRLGARACWLIAVHPDSPSRVLDHLANLGAVAFQERVAENSNTWPTTLARLATCASS